MNLKRLLDRLGDDVNPLVVLEMRKSFSIRIVTAILYLVMFSVFSVVLFHYASIMPEFVVEPVFVAIFFFTLYFLTLRTICGFGAFWNDEAITLASKAMTPVHRLHGKGFPFFFDGLWVWAASLPFMVLVSTVGISFWWLLGSATTICLAVESFVMMVLLFSVNDGKPKKGDWTFIIPMALTVAATPIILLIFMECFSYAPSFFLIVLVLYCTACYILCRVHLRWNPGHPYREAIVNGLVFGPFGIAVFTVGYVLFA